MIHLGGKPITDAELEGIAAQAANMAKRDLERECFNFLFAVVEENGTLYRMRGLEATVIEKLGRDWLNDGRKKDLAFSAFRKVKGIIPPDVVIFATAANMFTFTAKATPEQITELVACGHDRHHQAVRDGLMEVLDSLTVVAQTPDRVCIYNQGRDPLAGWMKAEVRLIPQGHFNGRLKLFGRDDEPTAIM